MKRRVLAILCVLSILMGMVVMPAAAETTANATTDGKYDVGYSKKDVNPWVQSEYISIGIPAQYTDADGNLVDYTDAATYITDTTVTNHDLGTTEVQTPLVKVKLSGYGTISTRLAESVSDDNGDGLVGLGDGLQVTVTSVTDDWGKTVMYITIDSIGGYYNFTKDVRAAIVKALGADKISASEIMVSGSHSHEAPDLDNCRNAEAGTALRAYYDYYVATATAAALEAYNGRSAANMTKGSIEASDYFGTPLNFVRHYDITKTEGVIWQTTHTWVGGDNFGGSFSEDSDDGFFDSSSTTLDHVSEANQTMNILQFTRENNENPIVLLQWQAHPSIMGQSDRTNISSDYINALRYRLENNKTKFGGNTDYCVGFWQGTGGNMNNASRISSEYTYTPANPTGGKGWVATDPSTVGLTLSTDGTTSTTTTQNRTYRNALYGYILGKVALQCLGNNMTDTLDMGKIRTVQSKYAAERQQDSEGLIAAAAQWRTEYDAGTTITYPYTYTHDGVVYALNSYYHAYNVEQRAKSTSTHTTLELNAIMLGSQVAMVTAPLELFDRYSLTATTGSTSDNDWDDLTDSTYGEPFILSKSNNRAGYVPNKLAYNYYTDQTGTVAEGTAMGSYEANITIHAEGVGEAIVAHYGEMLDLAQNGYVEGTCPKCGEVEWEPLTAEATSITNFGSGHYYLTEDMPRMVDEQTQKIINTGDVLCINLNGYTMETEGRSFNVANNGEVSIINTALKNAGSTGIVRSYSEGNNPGGGTVNVASGGIFNLYGGTMEFVKEDDATYGTGVGGIFSLTGTLNMYGGTITGAELADSSYGFSNDGCGGAIYMYGGAVLNVYGGNITSGTLPTTNDLPTAGAALVAAGPCVYMSASTCKVNLYNNASVEDIYYKVNNGSNVTISGTYTGTAGLTFADSITLSQNMDVGNVESGAVVSGVTCTNQKANGTYWQVHTSGTNLVLYGYDDSIQAVIVDGTSETEYTSLANAISNYTSNGSNYIKLIKAPTDTAVTVSSETYLDLNGNDVDAAIDASAAPLYVMDSMTDDYNVKDSYGYGKLTGTLTGTIEGVSVDSDVAADGYLKVNEGTEEDPQISFHRVNLQLSATNLRAQSTDGTSYDPGMYYSIVEGFSADSVVAALINSSADNYYGVAMLADDGDTSNDKEIPSAATLKDDNHSKYSSFTAGKGKNAANGTLLSGILKESNNVLINRRNANITVYGSAYIKIGDQYMFGSCVEQSLRNLFVGKTVVVGGVEKTQTPINNRAFLDALNDTQWECVLGLYEKYQSMIDAWITESGETNHFQAILNDAEYNALKILVVGNSHGLDATNLLYEVFEDQKQNGKYVTADGREYNEVVIGNLYHSGANMYQHSTWIDGDIEYSYDKIGTGDSTGVEWQIMTQDNCMDDALADEQWDIVVMQQMNHRSGITGTASIDNTNFNQANYQAVAKHIKEMCPDAKLAWHMVWTNPDEAEFFDDASSTLAHPTVQTGSNMDWITNHNDWYGTDGRYVQSNLYAGIVEALETKILNKDWMGYDIDYVLPSAVAVEYAQDILGCSDDVLYRDYTHVNNYGRLMVAYTWWATLMGYDSIGTNIISEIPGALDHGQANKNENLATNDAGNFVVTGDLKSIITKSVNYALGVNDPTFTDANAYQIVEDDSIAILGIGNSYTMDCMWMLGQIYAAENPDKDVKLGVAYISGGTLQQHASGQALDKFYYLDSASGTWQTTSITTLDDAIAYYDWDLVSLQQGSTKSVDASTYDDSIQTIQSKVTNILGYTPEFFWNQTWTWSLTHASVGTTAVQTQRFENIISAVKEKIVPDNTFSMIMPVGVAIQNAIPHVEDSDLFCDTVHLGAYGRLIAGYVLYCQLENVASDALTELKVTSTPAAYSKIHSDETKADVSHTDEQMLIALEAVRNALITGRDCTFVSTDLTDLISG